MRYGRKLTKRGFSLIELVIILALLGILAVLTYSYAVPKYRERANLTRGVAETSAMANALTLYVSKYNDYPADVNRDVPAGIKEFLKGQYADTWPDAPWPGSVYDYDRWDDIGVVQISVRFCPAGDTPTCKKNFPKESWVTDAWDSNSSVYYCLKGLCRSHQSQPVNHPGHCLNCGGSSQFY